MPRRADDRVKLLHGPYRASRLRVGDRATSLFRDCLVVVTGWTDGLTSWPRGLPLGERGHPSILVNEELARAVRLESAPPSATGGGCVTAWSTAGGRRLASRGRTTAAPGG
jgi:hypothetical protein